MHYPFLRLFEPSSNASEVTACVVNLLNVKITQSTIKKEIEEHPDFPSLFAISDVLNKFAINNIGIRPNSAKFSEIPVPFITRIRDEKNLENFYTVVKENSQDSIVYFDPLKLIWRRATKNDFLKGWHGFALLVQHDGNSGERSYIQKKKAEEKRHLVYCLVSFSFPFLVIFFGLLDLVRNGSSVIIPLLYLIISLAGCITSFLLLWYEIDDKNSSLNHLCTPSKKVNCGAVLHSNASKLGGVSWSAIGLSYFSGQLALLLFGRFEDPSLYFFLWWAGLTALPYICFSIYFQWRVINQWCVLCLSIQFFLIFQFLIAVFNNWLFIEHNHEIALWFLLHAFPVFASCFAAVLILTSLLQKNKENNEAKKSLQRLKNNPELFWSLLQQQKILSADPFSLGITIGNPNSKYKILKVCNPYCGPCAKAHQELHTLLDLVPDLQVQIIFTINTSAHTNAKIVKHFLAIDEKFDESTKRQALDDWYMSKMKNYESFSSKYSLTEELNEQNYKIDAMHDWCEKVKIESTPTIFLAIPDKNGECSSSYFQLPSIYGIDELKYLFETAVPKQNYFIT
jgi:uncharacterized membrane protein